METEMLQTNWLIFYEVLKAIALLVLIGFDIGIVIWNECALQIISASALQWGWKLLAVTEAQCSSAAAVGDWLDASQSQSVMAIPIDS